MAKQATLSMHINFELKGALVLFCKKNGLKIQSVVEEAIKQQIEDEVDLSAYLNRKNEDEISLKDILKKMNK